MLRDTVSCLPARTDHTDACVTMTHGDAAALPVHARTVHMAHAVLSFSKVTCAYAT